MKPKTNTIIGILLFIFFSAAFITGKLAEHNQSYSESHEIVSTIALIFVILHIIGCWPTIKNCLKLI